MKFTNVTICLGSLQIAMRLQELHYFNENFINIHFYSALIIRLTILGKIINIYLSDSASFIRFHSLAVSHLYNGCGKIIN